MMDMREREESKEDVVGLGAGVLSRMM